MAKIKPKPYDANIKAAYAFERAFWDTSGHVKVSYRGEGTPLVRGYLKEFYTFGKILRMILVEVEVDGDNVVTDWSLVRHFTIRLIDPKNKVYTAKVKGKEALVVRCSRFWMVVRCV